MEEGNIFSLFVSPHLGEVPHPCRGVPQPGSDGGYPSQVLTRGFPIQVQVCQGYAPKSGPEEDGGAPPAGMGIVLDRVTRARDRVLPGKDGIPLPPVRTKEGALATQWSVCLLRSHRRTFLCIVLRDFPAPQSLNFQLLFSI